LRWLEREAVIDSGIAIGEWSRWLGSMPRPEQWQLFEQQQAEGK